MLEAMRTRAQGWIAGFIVAILALAFGLWGVEYYITARSGGEVVAKVNGTEISATQVNKVYGQLRQRAMAQLGENFPADPAFQKLLKQNALQEIISRTVIGQVARKSGYKVSQEQVINEIKSNPAFQMDGQFSPIRFEQVLQRLGYSQDQFFREYSDSMVAGQIQTGIQFTSFALPNETKQAAALSEQQRSFKFLTIPSTTFLKSITVSDDEAKSYYEKNKEHFMDPMKIRVDYIELSMDDFKNKINPTEQQLKDYYKENVQFFSSPRQWQITQWKILLPAKPTNEQIEAAKSQLDAVKQGKTPESLNKVTNETRWLSASKENHELVKRLSQLKKGEYTDVFAADNTIEVVKLLAVKDPQPVAFEAARANVAQQFSRHEIDREFVERSDQLSELVYTNPDSLNAAADELGVKIKTSEYFTEKGGETEFTKNPKVVKAAFADDVLVDSNNSSVIEVSPGHLAVLRIKDKVDSKPKQFSVVRSNIIDQIKREKAELQVKELGDKVVQSRRANAATPSSVANLALKWQDQQNVTRHQNGINADVIQLAFRVPDPKFVKGPSVRGVITAKGDYIIVEVLSVEDKSAAVNEQHKKVFADNISTGFGKLEFDLYIKSLMDGADIKIMKGDKGDAVE